MSIFKACDIRGIAGLELTADISRRIGNALPVIFNVKKIVVGYDIRLSSEELRGALVQGAIEAGCDVIDLGLIPTEVCYFAAAELAMDAGVMITASHNPAEYNGMKICGPEATPINYESGIGAIEEYVKGDNYYRADRPGSLKQQNVLDLYVRAMLTDAGETSPLKVVVDSSNGMGTLFTPYLKQYFPHITFIHLNSELDGLFPGHSPNPMMPESREQLSDAVREHKADLGVIFDGDADRIMFIDENGVLVKQDTLLMLIAEFYLNDNPGAAIVHDVRSSAAVAESVTEQGGLAVRSKVGHTNVKQVMRDVNAVFGGELSAHYYFRENSCCDSSLLALSRVLTIISDKKMKLSEIGELYEKYYSSGEKSFRVADQDAVITEIKTVYSAGEFSCFDGLTVTFSDWWFNVRKSITEPYLRLNVEAHSKELLDDHVAELTRVIAER